MALKDILVPSLHQLAPLEPRPHIPRIPLTLIRFVNATLDPDEPESFIITLDTFLGWPQGEARARELSQLIRLINWRKTYLNGTFFLAACIGLLTAVVIVWAPRAFRGHGRHWTKSAIRSMRRLYLSIKRRTCTNDPKHELEEAKGHKNMSSGPDDEEASKRWQDKAKEFLHRVGRVTWARNPTLPLPIRLYCMPEMFIGTMIFSVLSFVSLLQFTPPYFALCLSRTFSSIAAEQVIAVDIVIIVFWTMVQLSGSRIERALMPVLIVTRIGLQLVTPIFRPAVLVPIPQTQTLYYCLRVSIWQFGTAQISFDASVVLYSMTRHAFLLMRHRAPMPSGKAWWEVAQYPMALIWFVTSIPETIGFSGRQELHALHAVMTIFLLCKSARDGEE